MLKLQYFGHLMQRPDSLEKILMLAKTEGRRRTTEDEMVGQHHRLNGHLSKLREMVKVREAGMLQFIGLQRVRHILETEKQQSIAEKS